jgi:RNA polymerase sigma-70 factor (ECF subfamily)
MKSFEETLKPHYNDALRYCTAICSGWSADEAEDVLQQALLTAWQHFDELRDTASFKSWLFTIITRTFLRSTRRHFWRRFVPLADAGAAGAPEVLAPIRSSDDVLDLLDCLSRLSGKERATVLLHEVAGFTVEEIAAMVGDKSASAVKSRLSRSRKKLRRAVTRITVRRTRAEARAGETTDGGDIEDETIRLVRQIRQDRSGR